MGHPFENIPAERRRQIFLPALAATIVIFVAWVLMVSPMSNEKAPLSVSSFGMAGSLERAREMIDSWDQATRLIGSFGIGFDFLQLVVYSTTFALSCAWIAQRFRREGNRLLSGLGYALAWGQWLAVVCGTVQNGVMMALLVGSGSEFLVRASFWATLLKLVLLVLGPTYSALGYLYLTARSRADR